MYKPILIALLLIFSGCDKDEELSPQQKILGKWRLIEAGNWPKLNPATREVYLSFYSDSTMVQLDIGLKSSVYCDYWVDSILHLIQYDVNPIPIHYMNKYTFYENRLRLEEIRSDNEDPRTRIYQRVPF